MHLNNRGGAKWCGYEVGKTAMLNLNTKSMTMNYSGCHVRSLPRSLHVKHHFCTFRHNEGTL